MYLLSEIRRNKNQLRRKRHFLLQYNLQSGVFRDIASFHSKIFVHRDLVPSDILVGLVLLNHQAHEGQGEPQGGYVKGVCERRWVLKFIDGVAGQDPVWLGRDQTSVPGCHGRACKCSIRLLTEPLLLHGAPALYAAPPCTAFSGPEILVEGGGIFLPNLATQGKI